MEYDIAGKKGWKFTHSKNTRIDGASFCRYVDMDKADWKRKISLEEYPTCKICKKILSMFRQLDIEQDI